MGKCSSTQLEIYLLGFVENYCAADKGCECCNYNLGTHVFNMLYLINTNSLTLKMFMAKYVPYFADSLNENLDPRNLNTNVTHRITIDDRNKNNEANTHITLL